MTNLYLSALGLDPEREYATKEIHAAYRTLAANGDHPDHGGNAERWQLITAAYNELKAMAAKKRGGYGRKSDIAWAAEWEAVSAPKAKRQKAEKTGYASTHGTGTVSDPSRRCGAETKSGPCVRAFNHPHGHMSAAVRDKKTANAKAKKAAAKAAAAAENAEKTENAA